MCVCYALLSLFCGRLLSISDATRAGAAASLSARWECPEGKARGRHRASRRSRRSVFDRRSRVLRSVIIPAIEMASRFTLRRGSAFVATLLSLDTRAASDRSRALRNNSSKKNGTGGEAFEQRCWWKQLHRRHATLRSKWTLPPHSRTLCETIRDESIWEGRFLLAFTLFRVVPVFPCWATLFS